MLFNSVAYRLMIEKPKLLVQSTVANRELLRGHNYSSAAPH